MTDAQLPFVRITVIGSTGCGKTSLVNAFVNNMCPVRYIRTEGAVVYHKKTLVQDEDRIGTIERPMFVEVEDTPGSEQGPEDVVESRQDDDGPPKVRKGVRVIVKTSEADVKEMFTKSKGKLGWKPLMRQMLGKEYPVRSVNEKNQTVGLPSPDGSEGGIWTFPLNAVQLKVAIDLPIDKFLVLDERTPSFVGKTPQEKKADAEALQVPFSFYERPLQDKDQTMTKNRMGYFICFDMADNEATSLKEAMSLQTMLREKLSKERGKFEPIVRIIGTKMDMTSQWNAIKLNRSSAQAWSRKDGVPFSEVSAKEHKNVTQVFHEMILTIRNQDMLWSFESPDTKIEESGDQGGCFSQ